MRLLVHSFVAMVLGSVQVSSFLAPIPRVPTYGQPGLHLQLLHRRDVAREGSDGDSDSVSGFIRANSSTAAEGTSVRTPPAALAPASDPNVEPAASSAEGSVFDRMLDYPTTFQIKVIGLSQGHFASDMIDICSRVTGVPSEDIKFSLRDTKTKKYRSVTIDVPVESAAMLYACYEALSKDPRVKFKF